jgi:hypothetical protein
VTFKDGSATLGTGTLSGGVASLTLSSLAVGSHSLTAVYGGDSTFQGSTSAAFGETVSQDATGTVLTSSAATAVFGQSVTFTATVSASSPGSGTPTGTVTFKDGSTTLGTGTLSNGKATLKVSNLAVAGHTITAVYGGDANFQANTSAGLTETINQASSAAVVTASANPVALGQSVTFTVTVSATAPGAGTPTGTVTFNDGSTVLGTATLSARKATFTTASLAAGPHVITVAYSGDANFLGSTSAAITETVNSQTQATTTTTLAANPTTVVYGQSVSFTAGVSASSGTPTGTVTFMDGSTPLGTAALSAGQASLAVASLSAGSHSITAVYNGDANDQGSTSAAVTETVNAAATATALSSSTLTATTGQPITFAITVAARSPGSGTPTGTVTFKDGSATLGTATLNGNGQASIVVSTLAAGSHTITAVYAGNASYGSSTSAAVTETITAPVGGTPVAGITGPASAVVGQALTYTLAAGESGLPAATVYTFQIDWDGNGTIDQTVSGLSGTTVSHTYGGVGSYAISVTATDPSGHTSPAAGMVTAIITGGANARPAFFVTGADAGGGPQVNVYNATTGALEDAFFAYNPAFTGGVRVAAGDVNGDGIPDVICAAGPGGGPHVEVFDGRDVVNGVTPHVLYSFFAFDRNFTGGVYLASGDVNADGYADLICSADGGGGPDITVFSGKDGSLLMNFFAYDRHFTGGVRVAAGDVNGDGHADIVCGAGPGGGPDVTVFSGADGRRLLNFFAYNPAFSNGIYVGAADLNNDGHADLICGAGAGGGPNVTVFNGIDGGLMYSFFPYDPGFTGGVRVAGVTNTQGRNSLVAVAGPGGGPQVSVYQGATAPALVDQFFALDPRFSGGLYVAGSGL